MKALTLLLLSLGSFKIPELDELILLGPTGAAGKGLVDKALLLFPCEVGTRGAWVDDPGAKLAIIDVAANVCCRANSACLSN